MSSDPRGSEFGLARGFAYRIELGPFAFIASGVLALAWLTVAVVASRAASAKPVTALRYE
jgi:putative ABC transport system permease protein